MLGILGKVPGRKLSYMRVYVLSLPLWVWLRGVAVPISSKRKWRTRSACPVLQVGHREETAVHRTLCLREVQCCGDRLEERDHRHTETVSQASLGPMWQDPSVVSEETEPRIQMEEVLESATQQGLSKQRAADGAEKKHILCSSVPDVNSKCQKKILRKGKAKFCKRHGTPTLQWSEHQTESVGSKSPFFFLGWS